MNVPFNDLKRRFARRRALVEAEAGRLVESGIFIGDPAVAAFERSFAERCGCAHGIGVASGTDGLELALRAFGLRKGDEVVTVANAGGSATVACLAIGVRPVYADILPDTLQIDFQALEAALSVATRAVVVTHLYGYMNDVRAVRAQLDRLGREDVRILEDCSQAHGARLDGAFAGSLGDAAAFSFHPANNLGAMGDAGSVMCQDPALAEKVRALRQHGWTRRYRPPLSGGHNSRMDPLQALVLAAELQDLDENNARRRRICGVLAQALPEGWRLIHEDSERFVGHLAVARAPDMAARDRLRAHLTEAGIGSDIHFPILDCDQPAWAGTGRIGRRGLDESRKAAETVLSLPCFPELTEIELERIADALRGF